MWYYVNSPLVSTEDPDVVNAYTSVVDAENNDLRPVTWNAITSLYDHTSVTGSARAAAIQKPVQYGVALMTVQMQRVTSSNLKDARGNNVAVNNKKFPLTGIILADQHPVGFDFKPTAESSGAIRYIYDSEVNTSLNGTPLAYLSSNSGASSSVSMLALPTLENQPVHFALEFRNTSNNSFFAADGGEVFPTSCFYLLGVLRVSEGLNYGSDVLTSVFTSDHNTIVKVNVKSLANSYSVLPSLDDPQLLIGVEAEMTWDFAEPSIVPIQ